MLRAPVKPPLLGLRLVAQHAGTHHRRQRQGDQRRDQNGDAQGHGKLAKQPADNVAHEQQGDEYGDERQRQRQDGEADLVGAFERGLQGGLAAFDVAHNIFDHDDGIIDHKTCGDVSAMSERLFRL